MNEQDEAHLRRAIEVSVAAREHGNHPFGAVLVDAAGQIVAEAENTVVTDRDVTAHAETNLVRRGGSNRPATELAGFTLYSSCEPCAMCSGAIFWAGIGRVVFALSVESLLRFFDDRPDTPINRIGSRRLLTPGDGVEVMGPALEDEAAAAHAGFWGP
ncbi:MAG: nucleoside deaminase [Acidimicrobiia bacterium]|nr:nucleoside deaminase [Acidimicrobiia bacterium]